MDREIFRLVASRARKLREERAIPVSDMANKIGVSTVCLHRFERAEERIELDKLMCLVNVLGVPLTSLYMSEDGTVE